MSESERESERERERERVNADNGYIITDLLLDCAGGRCVCVCVCV